MLAEPLKLTPAIVLAVCNLVAVAALPVQEPEEPDTVVCTIFGAVFVIVNVPPLEVEVSSDCIPVPWAKVTVSPFVTVLVSVPLPSLIIQEDIEPPEDVTYPESFVHWDMLPLLLVNVCVLLGVVVPCGLLNDVVKVPPSFCVSVNVIVEEPESDIAVIWLS